MTSEQVVWSVPESPYPGLRPFHEEEGFLFCGRDRQIDAIVDRLRRHRFVVITGASGCGKSSLVLAGVLPGLARGLLEEAGDFWVEIYFRPGKDPLGNLQAALVEKLLPEAEAKVDTSVRDLLASRDALASYRELYEKHISLGGELDLKYQADQSPTAENASHLEGTSVRQQYVDDEVRRLRRKANIIIIADQFEEVFNEFNRGTADAESLVDTLLHPFRHEWSGATEALQPRERVFVLLTMRSEYLGECATYREMPDVLNQAAFLVRRLERSELRAAAEQPLPKWRRAVTNSRLAGAHAVDFQLDPQLTDLLLDAVAQSKDDPDHLPLFQHALGRLWWLAKESASDPSATIAIGMQHLTRALGFSDESALKDVPNEILLARILEAHAEEVLSSFSNEQQRIVQTMLRRMASKDDSGHVVRRLVSVADIAACAGCSRAAVDTIVAKLGAESHDFVQPRRGSGKEENLIDLSHEALIRKWPRFLQWVADEDNAKNDLAELSSRVHRWVEQGALLNDDDLATARRWREATLLYRRDMPGSLRAWAGRYHVGANEDWLSKYDGPESAVDELYRQSVAEAQRREQETRQQIQREAERAEREQRQKAEHERALAKVQAQEWRARFIGILGIVLVAGLTGAYILNDAWNKRVLLEQQKRTLEQQQLTRLADLKAVAMANGGQPISLLPEFRRLARYQELGVLLHEVEDRSKLPLDPKHRRRIGSLEAEADTVMRQALDQTVDVRRLEARDGEARDGQVEAVGECLQRAEGGRKRQVLSTSTVPLESESDVLGYTVADTFAMLTKVDEKIALETVKITQLRHQWTQSLFVSSCQVGSDQAVMDIAPTNDVALDPTGRWLIEWPRTRGALTGEARLRRLDWFQICLPAATTGTCDKRQRQWHVEHRLLGDYREFAQSGVLPIAPADMPPVTPVFVGPDESKEYAKAFNRPANLDNRLKTTTSQGIDIKDDNGQTFSNEGNELRWDNDILVSNPAAAGFLITAFAKSGDLIAFVASTMARNAKGAANSKGVATVCKGHELCHHYVRVVRAETASQRAQASINEIAKIDFVGPPLDGIAFGEDDQSGELVVRFPGTASYAAVVWDRRSVWEWLCQSYISKKPMDPTVKVSREFETFIQESYEGKSFGDVVGQACPYRQTVTVGSR